MLRKPRMYDPDIASHHAGISFEGDPSRAQQNMAEQCDINNLVKLYAKTGQIPGADLPGYQFSVDEVFDFQSAMNQIRQSQEAFADLPSNLRDRFHNNPAEFLEFIGHEHNRSEAERLGLISPQPTEPPAPTHSTPPAPPADSKPPASPT